MVADCYPHRLLHRLLPVDFWVWSWSIKAMVEVVTLAPAVEGRMDLARTMYVGPFGSSPFLLVALDPTPFGILQACDTCQGIFFLSYQTCTSAQEPTCNGMHTFVCPAP